MKTSLNILQTAIARSPMAEDQPFLRIFKEAGLNAKTKGPYKVHITLNHGFTADVDNTPQDLTAGLPADYQAPVHQPAEPDEDDYEEEESADFTRLNFAGHGCDKLDTIELICDDSAELTARLLQAINAWPEKLKVNKVVLSRINALEFEAEIHGFKITLGVRYDGPLFRCKIDCAKTRQSIGYSCDDDITTSASPILNAKGLEHMFIRACVRAQQLLPHGSMKKEFGEQIVALCKDAGV